MTDNSFLPVGRTMDIAGQRFGRLVAMGIVRLAGRWKRPIWLCVCDCGGTTSTCTSNLRTGHAKSCGCQTGSRLDVGESSFNKILSRYRREAVNRGLDFELTREQFKSLTKSNCAYCGSPPAQVSKPRSHRGEYVYTGVDRINNSLGYTAENSAPCCRSCNDMKGVMSRAEFISQAQRIAAFGGAK